MGGRAQKDALFDAFAATAKALSNGRRAEIVDLLAQAPRSVEDIATQIEQSVANTSHHLRILAQAGLVRSQRNGVRIIYAVASATVDELWRSMRAVAAEQDAQIDKLTAAYLGDRTGLEPITQTELARRLRSRDVTLIDVRPAHEFEHGHIAGARSIPFERLAKEVKSLPRSDEVVAYCRGHYCVFADDAVRLLRKRGFNARRLADGFPEWRAAGLPVAEGEK